MIIKTDEYTIDCSSNNKGILKGSMRLPSPLSYENSFELLKKGIDISTNTYFINIEKLEYLNSSGLTALARLLIQARKVDTPVTIECSKNIPWQSKSIASLCKLWDKIQTVYQ